MIDAHETARIARAFRAHDRAAVAAGVEQAMESALLVPAEDHRPSGDLARAKVAGILQFGGVSYVDPAAAEYVRHLLAKDVLGDEDFAVEQEGFSLAVVDDVGAGGHLSSVGSAAVEFKLTRPAKSRCIPCIGRPHGPLLHFSGVPLKHGHCPRLQNANHGTSPSLRGQ